MSRKMRLLVVISFIFLLVVTSLTGCATKEETKESNENSPKQEENYPSKPITVIVQYPAGGTVDVGVRTLAPYWEKYLGTSLVIVNKPGASGELALSELAKAAPDGYTIGTWSTPPQNIVMEQRETSFNLDSFDWIGNQQADPYIIITRKDDARFNNINDLIEFAKSNPEKLMMGITGIQTATDLVTERIMSTEGVKISKVPFDGTPQALAALLGQHIDVMIEGTVALNASVKDGKTKVLAVFDSSRYELYPDIPTYKEATGNEVISVSLRGFLAPKGLPAERLEILKDTFTKAMSDPEFIEKAKQANLPLKYLSGEEFYQQNVDIQSDVREIIDKLKSN